MVNHTIKFPVDAMIKSESIAVNTVKDPLFGIGVKNSKTPNNENITNF